MNLPIPLFSMVRSACVFLCGCGVVLAVPADEAGGLGDGVGVVAKGTEPLAMIASPPQAAGTGKTKVAGAGKGKPAVGEEDEAEAEAAEKVVASKKPFGKEPVQVFGYIEWVRIGELAGKMRARLDTGARTSSLHVESEEIFDRDGAKWVRFVVLNPNNPKVKRVRISAPLVRWTRIKIPGGGSVRRPVVRLNMRIGDRKLRTEFSLNNRNNMLCPVLIGRRALRELGYVDASRIDLANKKIFR